MKQQLLDHYDKYILQKEDMIDRTKKYQQLVMFINEYKIFLQKEGLHIKKKGSLNIFFSKHIFYNPLHKRIEWKSTFGKLKYIYIYKIKYIKKSIDNPLLLLLYIDFIHKQIWWISWVHYCVKTWH